MQNIAPEDIYLRLIDKERNIYETSELFEQNRHEVSHYIEHLANSNDPDETPIIKGDKLVFEKSGKTYSIKNNLIDFTNQNKIDNPEWEKLNAQFLNYHKSLSLYTFINSAAYVNYVALKTGLGFTKNARVVDVGGGTGHTFCSFFQHPETIEYYLLDPNLRLLHDQFVRIYPKLNYLKMAHMLAFAESLPFKTGFADIVFSFSAIDHYKDYTLFIKEAHRILKKGGTLFISSHLDLPIATPDKTKLADKLFSNSFFERLTRYLYYKKHKVGKDDHTYHFEDTKDIESEIIKAGFTIEQSHTFKSNFFITAKK